MGSSGGGPHATGTGVGSNFRFVCHLEWKPACRVDPLVVVRLVTRYRVEARALKRNLGSTPRLSSLDGHLSLHRSARGAPLGPARSTQVRCTCGSVEHTHTQSHSALYTWSLSFDTLASLAPRSTLACFCRSPSARAHISCARREQDQPQASPRRNVPRPCSWCAHNVPIAAHSSHQ
jgi:hypothetical protein